jgi:hypothetical protein
VTPDARTAIQVLLRYDSVADDAIDLAERATEQFRLLATRIARLIGALGVQSLFSRAVFLARQASATDAEPELRGDPLDALQVYLAHQRTEPLVHEAAVMLEELISLLERLIGRSLVTSLLHETWPEIYPSAKELP